MIIEGKNTGLLHGLLSFFKHVFADFTLPVLGEEGVNEEEFNAWRDLYKELIKTCLEVNNVCCGILSNNRLTEEGTDMIESTSNSIPQKK